MKKNIAVICARSGSKGLKNKNIKLLNNKPLIGWSIELAKKNKNIHEVYVSTDSKKISKIAESYGAIVPFIRPKKLATDNSKEWDVLKHFVNYLKKNNLRADSIVNLPCTSPFKKNSDIDRALNLFYKYKYNAVISVTESYRNPMFNMTQIKKNKVTLAIKSKKKFYNRQDAPKFFDMTTIVYIYSPKYIIKSNHLFSGSVGQIIIPKKRSIDVDTIDDFKLCEYNIKKNDF